MSLTVLNVSYNQLSGFLTPVPSGSVFATESVLCCAGPPLPEALKLLAPLANLEELSLGGNALGGTITADVEVFTKLKKLDLNGMNLDGKRLIIRSGRFVFAIEVDVVFMQGLCRRCSQFHSRYSILATTTATATSSLVESRLNGAL